MLAHGAREGWSSARRHVQAAEAQVHSAAVERGGGIGAARRQSPGSFMMIFRMAKKTLGFDSGLVKKSAQLFAVLTNGTDTSNFSTMSRTKKWRRSMCLVVSWDSGL